jgi:hypothetical protein
MLRLRCKRKFAGLITKVKQCQAKSVFGWLTTVKSWFNLPFTKTHRVVLVLRVENFQL